MADTGEVQLHFLDYWRVIKVRFGIILLAFLLVVITAAVTVAFLPRQYFFKVTLEVKPDVHDAFNVKVDEANRWMAWGSPGVNSWYKNAAGRVLTTSPWRLVDYWSWTRAPSLDDYTVV